MTLEAYGDERAILDGSAEAPAARWQLAAGLTNVYVTPYEKGTICVDRRCVRLIW